MNKKRRNWILVISTVLVVVILVIVGKQRSGQGIEVQTTQMKKRTIVSSVAANGKIRPEGEVKISADVSGEIIALEVKEGDTVEQGQLLLRIEPSLYLSAVDRAKANLSSARSAHRTNQVLLDQAMTAWGEQQRQFERSETLFAQEVISTAEYQASQNALQLAQGEVDAAKERLQGASYSIANAEASLNEAQKNLARTRIFAPTDGVISKLNVEQGERVVGTAQMAGTEIMVLSNFDNMEVLVDVNENDILQVQRGDSCVVEVDAYLDRGFMGVVTEIARSASSLSPTMNLDQVTNYQVKIRILKTSYADLRKEMDAPFLPGMSASVEIQTEIARDVWSLPIEAVSTRERERDSTERSEHELDEVVFCVEGDVAVKKVIRTGIQDSRYIRILEGLEEDDKVIKGPYSAVSKLLEDGKKVTL